MDIVEYFSEINQNCQDVFKKTMTNPKELGLVYDLSSILYEWSEVIDNEKEKELIKNVGNQIELSTLNLSTGLYRQSFYSLRLSLELFLGTIYFSVHKLDYMEWVNGTGDIHWSKLIDEENGVLSKRFARAFFPALIDEINTYRDNTIILYRKLSEYVHGNYGTWLHEGPNIKINKVLFEQYFSYISSIKEIITFLLTCRYLKSLSNHNLDLVSESLDVLKHIEPIRCCLGGPKEQ